MSNVKPRNGWISVNDEYRPKKGREVVAVDDDFDSFRWFVAKWDGESFVDTLYGHILIITDFCDCIPALETNNKAYSA